MNRIHNYAVAGEKDGLADAKAGVAPIAADAWARHIPGWGAKIDEQYVLWYYRSYALACWRLHKAAKGALP